MHIRNFPAAVLSEYYAFYATISIREICIYFLFVTAYLSRISEFSHPPAIALAIFSYIAADPLDFTISSLLALAALLASSLILDRYAVPKRK